MCVVLCCVVVLCGVWCAVVFCSFRSRRRCAIQNENPISRSIGKIILAKCPNTVWVSDGEELAEVSDIEVS